MNKICTYSSKRPLKNCEFLTKTEKVYNKYKKNIANLSKVLYSNKSENDFVFAKLLTNTYFKHFLEEDKKE